MQRLTRKKVQHWEKRSASLSQMSHPTGLTPALGGHPCIWRGSLTDLTPRMQIFPAGLKPVFETLLEESVPLRISDASGSSAPTPNS